MSDAPFCAVQPPAPKSQPVSPLTPSIPIATDLPSAIAAINAMRQLLLTITNQISNNSANGFGGGAAPGTGVSTPKKQNGNFTEVKRTTRQTRIPVQFDAQGNAYAVMTEIVSLSLKDPALGATWTWTRGG